MRLYRELDDEDKRALLCRAYINDGADDNTAEDCAESDEDPDRTLRDVFGYDDEIEVNI